MNTKEQADELVKLFYPYAEAGALSIEEQTTNATNCAIASTENTIKVLESSEIQADNQERLINSLLKEQNELLAELMSRL